MIGSLFVPYWFAQKHVLGVWPTSIMARKVFCSISSVTPYSWKRSLNWLWSRLWLANPLAKSLLCHYFLIGWRYIWIFSTCIFGGFCKSGNTGAENPASWAFIQVQTLAIKLDVLLWWILSACVCAPTSDQWSCIKTEVFAWFELWSQVNVPIFPRCPAWTLPPNVRTNDHWPCFFRCIKFLDLWVLICQTYEPFHSFNLVMQDMFCSPAEHIAYCNPLHDFPLPKIKIKVYFHQ